MDGQLNFAEIQGNILRGYGKKYVRHLVLGVDRPAAARRWLRDAVSGDDSLTHQITNAELWDARRPTCVNLGITHSGLAALGTPRCHRGSGRRYPPTNKLWLLSLIKWAKCAWKSAPTARDRAAEPAHRPVVIAYSATPKVFSRCSKKTLYLN